MSPARARCPAISTDLAPTHILHRIRHRLVFMIVALPIALWAVLAFALVRDEGWVETLIRLVLLVAVVMASVWLLAAGFDIRHLGKPPAEVLFRLAGVALLAAVALFLTSDAWVFGGLQTKDASALEQGIVAAVWLAALGGAGAYRRTSVPPVAAPPGAVASPAPPRGLGVVRRWPHLIAGVLIAGPLFVGEGLLLLLMAVCGSDDALLNLTLAIILAVPVAFPGVGLVLDRRRRRPVPDSAGRPAPGPAGFAVAFGAMALAAFAHLVIVFVTLMVAATGYGSC